IRDYKVTGVQTCALPISASSSNHARPRASALISVGSHLELSFCVAAPGSTSLISPPRRRKATGAVSSIGLSLGFSDEGGPTAPQIGRASCREGGWVGVGA